MSEKLPAPPSFEGPPFKKGQLVRLRPDLDPKLVAELELEAGTAYRVFHYQHHDDEGGDSIWIGPADTDERLVSLFSPKDGLFQSAPDGSLTLDPAYREIRPMSVKFFAPVLKS